MEIGNFLILSFACVMCVNGDPVNKDCYVKTLEKLSFEQLFIKSNDCLEETQTVVNAKYNTTDFIFEGPFSNDLLITEKPREKEIHIHNFNVIKQILDFFDGSIRHVKIDFEQIDLADGSEIIKIMNGKPSSFFELHFRNCKGNVLDEWQNQFPNVVGFQLSSNTTERFRVKADKRVRDLLPQLRRLTVMNPKVDDWLFIGEKFPDLERFDVELPKMTNGIDESVALNILKSSPKVQYLTVMNPSLNLLKKVSDLSSLKNLTIDSISDDYSTNFKDRSVQFEQIKFLTLHDGERIPEKTMFNNIEELYLILKTKFTDKTMKFISNQVKNDNVTKFVFTSSDEDPISKENFLQIAENLPYTEEAYVEANSILKADDIVEFVAKTKNLKGFHLKIKMSDIDQYQLSSKLDFGWHISTSLVKGQDTVNILLKREQILMASGDGEGDVDGSHNANGNSNGNGAAFSVFHSIQLMIISFFCAILRSF